jgi:2-keto-3-deoxy-L-rhamnonate aldolase RhmA
VAACKYPPLGKRGSGAALATLRWPAPGGYADFADRNAMVQIIIEEKRAVEQIEEIAAVPGIDIIFIGTSDLSYSYGLRGRQDNPELQAAIRRVVAAARKNGIPVGRPALAGEIPRLMKEGFSVFQGASDLVLMAAGAAPLLEAVGKKAPDPKDRPLY